MKTWDQYILNLLPFKWPFAALCSAQITEILLCFSWHVYPFVCHYIDILSVISDLHILGCFSTALPLFVLFCFVCPLSFQQTSFSLTTTDSLQTTELLMRSDGQMDGHCENNYRVLCGSMWWEWRWARDVTSKLYLSSHTSSRGNKQGGFVLNQTSNWFFGKFSKSVIIRTWKK